MEDVVHMYLSSEDSRKSFPSNTSSNFRCLLPERLQLTEGKWRCALLELRLPEPVQQPLYLCSNICEESIAGEFKLPILARIDGELTQPNHVIYILVKTKELSVIEIYLYDRNGRPVSFSSGMSYCTLRFCKDEASCNIA